MTQEAEPRQRAAIVTGGASGIGAATAKRLASDGFAVAIADVDEQATAGGVAEIESGGGRAVGVPLDVRDEGAWHEAVERCTREWGRVDVLFNNAGITRDARVFKMTVEEWDEVVDVCLKGAWLGSRAVFPAMMEQKYGRLICTSSTSHLGTFGQTNYAAAKGGLIGMTRTLALEGARYGITANAVAPGTVDTPPIRALEQKHRDALLADIPMQRLADPEEIAAVVAFLGSAEASYVTGQVIHACGGASFGA